VRRKGLVIGEAACLRLCCTQLIGHAHDDVSAKHLVFPHMHIQTAHCTTSSITNTLSSSSPFEFKSIDWISHPQYHVGYRVLDSGSSFDIPSRHPLQRDPPFKVHFDKFIVVMTFRPSEHSLTDSEGSETFAFSQPGFFHLAREYLV